VVEAAAVFPPPAAASLRSPENYIAEIPVFEGAKNPAENIAAGNAASVEATDSDGSDNMVRAEAWDSAVAGTAAIAGASAVFVGGRTVEAAVKVAEGPAVGLLLAVVVGTGLARVVAAVGIAACRIVAC